jgi:hypothetical protein
LAQSQDKNIFGTVLNYRPETITLRHYHVFQKVISVAFSRVGRYAMRRKISQVILEKEYLYDKKFIPKDRY